jgi:hypothetical protein
LESCSAHAAISYEGLDFSTEFFEVAKKTIGGFMPRVTLTNAELKDPNWPKKLSKHSILLPLDSTDSPPPRIRWRCYPPRFRSPERQPSGSDARIADRAGHPPGSPYAASTGAGAPHAAQHLTDGAVPSIEGRKLGHGKGALAVAPGRKAIDGQIEAGQLVQRTGKDGGALSAG